MSDHIRYFFYLQLKFRLSHSQLTLRFWKEVYKKFIAKFLSWFLIFATRRALIMKKVYLLDAFNLAMKLRSHDFYPFLLSFLHTTAINITVNFTILHYLSNFDYSSLESAGKKKNACDAFIAHCVLAILHPSFLPQLGS